MFFSHKSYIKASITKRLMLLLLALKNINKAEVDKFVVTIRMFKDLCGLDLTLVAQRGQREILLPQISEKYYISPFFVKWLWEVACLKNNKYKIQRQGSSSIR